VPSLKSQNIAAQWAAMFFLSVLFAAGFEFLQLPAALLLGPMAAAVCLAGFETNVRVPKNPFYLAQAVVGCLIARNIPVSIIGELGGQWWLFLGSVMFVIAASFFNGWVLARLRVLPGATAIWGSAPGAATAMVLMSESFGADSRLVAFMQYLRVVFVGIAATLVAKIFHAHGGHLPAIVWFPRLHPLAMVETAALIVLAVVLGTRWRIPAGPLLLPVFIGAVLKDTGLMAIELPPWLLAISYALVGWSIGLRFSRPILAHAATALPRVVLSILTLIAICGAFAWVLVTFAGIDPLTAYLATSPGGADSVAIIAASSHVDVPFVMAAQMARFLIILAIGPALARVISHWLGPQQALLF
jgi:membrane AbrB-like protein